MFAQILTQPPVLVAATLAAGLGLITLIARLLGRPAPSPARVPATRRPR